jgi:hypothetical protein
MVSLSDGAMTIEAAGTYYRQHYSTVGEYYAPDEKAHDRPCARRGRRGSRP